MVDEVRQKNNEIKALLVRKGIRQVDIARKLNVTRGTVSAVLNGLRESNRVRRTIARALGLKVSDLWPREAGNKEAA